MKPYISEIYYKVNYLHRDSNFTSKNTKKIFGMYLSVNGLDDNLNDELNNKIIYHLNLIKSKYKGVCNSINETHRDLTNLYSHVYDYETHNELLLGSKVTQKVNKDVIMKINSKIDEYNKLVSNNKCTIDYFKEIHYLLIASYLNYSSEMSLLIRDIVIIFNTLGGTNPYKRFDMVKSTINNPYGSVCNSNGIPKKVCSDGLCYNKHRCGSCHEVKLVNFVSRGESIKLFSGDHVIPSPSRRREMFFGTK